jgi:Zn2+/Cd2+-exporting ATPase
MVQARYRIEGMDCASCAAKIEGGVRRVSGVTSVSVSVAAKAMTIEAESDTLDDAAVERKVASLGYRALPERESAPRARLVHDHGSHGQRHAHAEGGGPWWKSAQGRHAAVTALGVALAWAVGRFAPSVAHPAFVAAMLVGLVPIARRAVAAALNGMPFTIETLMSIAAVGAVIIGAAEEAAMVVLLFLVGELLEGVAAGRARASIRALNVLMPRKAIIEQAGTQREVDAQALKPGDVILARPGDRIPADGTILDGESAIDESAVTGESMPVPKGPGGSVFAGTVNGSAALRIRVTATSEDNTISRIVKLVEEAQESKAPTQRLIERFSRYYTPGVLVVSALVACLPPLLMGASWSAWIYKGLAVLLIGCPCALVISTPAAIAAALSAGARRGLLFKGGAALETVGRITVAAVDKTGTLTQGRPVVTDVVALGRRDADVIRISAALETGSSHPLARAILKKAADDGVAVPPATALAVRAGEGVTGKVGGRQYFLGTPSALGERSGHSTRAETAIATLRDAGKSVSALVEGTDIAGLIAMRDEPRPDARAGIDALKQAGISVVMLTGDNPATAEAIGGALGIEVRAGLKPEDKQKAVRELQERGAVVAKVGDGINDAPALAAADVGIAMGGGTDVALETADAAILNARVGDIAAMVRLSRRALGNIHQNIAIALGLKLVFLVTTILGVTGLWPAILADTGATVLVTANAMRLLRPHP